MAPCEDRVRLGSGHPDCPRRLNESFSLYLHRLAQFQGYIPESEPPPSERKVPKRHGQPGFLERLDAIFGRPAQPRQPGEDG